MKSKQKVPRSAPKSSAAGDSNQADAKERAAGTRSLTPIRQSTEVLDRRGRGAVLVVDDQSEDAEVVADALDTVGYRCDIAASGSAALEAVQKNHYDLVVTSLHLKGVDGFAVLRRARDMNPFVAVMVLTAQVESAVEAIQQGASDFLTKPVNVEELLVRAHKALESRRWNEITREQSKRLARSREAAFGGIVGNSGKMRQVMELCLRVAATDATILITGESGTGKELIAKGIHEISLRQKQRFVPINCAALSPSIIESELFGHEKGAFTGAAMSRKGYFEHSDQGTIFLDEVGDIPLETQVKLLRVLENRVITRVGSNEPIAVDVRVISATHRDLEQLVEQGKFREDLYYRLKVVTIPLPPLRERTEDIPLLAFHFMRQFAEAYGKNDITEIEPDVLAALMSHTWKGNVRELKHTIENLVVLGTGPRITADLLPESFRGPRRLPAGPAGAGPVVGVTIRDMERELIRNTLARVDGNRQEAARLLGIGERTLYRKIKRYALG